MAQIAKQSSKVRSNRMHNAQYEIYVKYVEEHRQFLSALMDYKYDENELQAEWQELTALLNKPPLPSKTVAQWKSALRQWRYSVISKARNYEEELIK